MPAAPAGGRACAAARGGEGDAGADLGLPVLDERSPDEIIGYDEHGLPS